MWLKLVQLHVLNLFLFQVVCVGIGDLMNFRKVCMIIIIILSMTTLT